HPLSCAFRGPPELGLMWVRSVASTPQAPQQGGQAMTNPPAPNSPADHFAILGIAGSLRQASYNRGLIRAAIEVAPAGVVVRSFDLHSIPLFNEDIESQGDPEPVAAMKAAIEGGDALIIASSDANRCITGVL